MNERMNSKIVKAAKWSGITEFSAKIIQPVTNVILARVLVPEAFGLMAVITMVISFANLFSDAGFMRYLIQHEFKSDEEKDQSTLVAFWTNLGISIGFWLVISLCRNSIASLLGHPDLGIAIAAACICLPLNSFSTVQTALYQRDLNFKVLFLARITGALIPVFVTIPLAVLGFHYWALIIGTICGNLWNAFILTVKSEWKIRFFYQYSILKEMLGFSIWSLIEAISIWVTAWVDIVIVGRAFTDYYLGIYTNSITVVNAFLNIVTTATAPILLSALSRLQANESEYKRVFFRFQGLVSLLLIPMGVGLYIYRELATGILFGKQWEEAALLVGLWGLISTFLIVFSDYSSIIFVSKGKPKISFLSQILYLSLMLPALIFSVRYSFETVIYVRVFIRLGGMVINLIFLNYCFRISPLRMFKNVYPALIGSLFMAGAAWFLRKLYSTVPWMLFSILICMMVYFAILMLISDSRKNLMGLAKQFPLKRISKNKRRAITVENTGLKGVQDSPPVNF